MSKLSTKSYQSPNLNIQSTFNDTTLSNLTEKYEILNENLNNLIKAMEDHKQDFQEFQGGNENIPEYIEAKAKQIEDNVGSSITRVDGEVQKSLSHQKAENSRLQQQISQLNTDQIVIKNQLLNIQKRIEDIQLQIGDNYTNID
jgi:chromosome segregation ATPase